MHYKRTREANVWSAQYCSDEKLQQLTNPNAAQPDGAMRYGGQRSKGTAPTLTSRVSQFWLIMFRRPPRLRERPGFLAG